MLAQEINDTPANEKDVRFWYKEIALQLANVNGNLFALRAIETATKTVK